MTALSDAVIALLADYLTDLGGRVFVSLIPLDVSMPAAVVDVQSSDDPTLGAGADQAGIERCTVSVRLTDEDTGEAGIGSLAVATQDALTGRDSAAPELEVDGWTVLDAGASTVRTYVTDEEDKRFLHALVSVEVVMERAP